MRASAQNDDAQDGGAVRPPEPGRNALLDAGQRLLGSADLARISVNAIVAEAGMAKGSFYQHWPSRTEYGRALHARFHDQLGESIAAAMADLPPGRDRLEAGMDAYLDGCLADPATKAVAVPIYQTVAYAFDSAEHGAALFNLEVPGHRYSRISNPTVAVLERRLAALHGGAGALCLASGQAALHNAILSIADTGRNIVSVPQLYGTTHTLFSHVLPRMGVTARFAASS